MWKLLEVSHVPSIAFDSCLEAYLPIKMLKTVTLEYIKT